MRSKTDDGKEYYDLWFILEGKGPNKGSVIKAFVSARVDEMVAANILLLRCILSKQN